MKHSALIMNQKITHQQVTSWQPEARAMNIKSKIYYDSSGSGPQKRNMKA